MVRKVATWSIKIASKYHLPYYTNFPWNFSLDFKWCQYEGNIAIEHPVFILWNVKGPEKAWIENTGGIPIDRGKYIKRIPPEH